MTNDNSRTSRLITAGKTLVVAVTRVLTDALILGLWVFLLVLIFLATNWPRWWFYLLLLIGVGGYVLLTAEWVRPQER